MLLALHTAAASTGLLLGDEPPRLAAAGLLAVVGVRYLLAERRRTEVRGVAGAPAGAAADSRGGS